MSQPFTPWDALSAMHHLMPLLRPKEILSHVDHTRLATSLGRNSIEEGFCLGAELLESGG
jgi:hypothetical protein